MALMSEFTNKMRRGELPNHRDWEDHLIEAHKLEPRMTPDAFAAFKTEDGQNSYDILAQQLRMSSQCVVDLACGDGHFIPYILPKLRATAKVVGVDMSKEGIDLAQEQIDDPRVSFILARAQALPLADHSVDQIFCHMAFMLMAPLEPVVAEIRRVLKPGGSFSAVVGSGSARGLYQEIRRMMGLFVQAHLPRFHEARESRTYVGSEDGLRILFDKGFEQQIELSEIQLRYHVPPEGIWQYLRNMYFLAMMPDHAQRELRDDLMAFARDHLDQDGKILFYAPMRIFSIQAL